MPGRRGRFGIVVGDGPGEADERIPPTRRVIDVAVARRVEFLLQNGLDQSLRRPGRWLGPERVWPPEPGWDSVRTRSRPG